MHSFECRKSRPRGCFSRVNSKHQAVSCYSRRPMPPAIAMWLGIVEGLTEYLPVSSTGHLVIAGHLLGLSDDDPATSSFEIVVQLGAILAVVAHYRALLAERARGLFSRDPAALRLLSAI